MCVEVSSTRSTLEPSTQADHHRTPRIEQRVSRIRELVVRAALFLVEVDHIDRELRNHLRPTEQLREVDAGGEIPLREIVTEQFCADHARLIAVGTAAL